MNYEETLIKKLNFSKWKYTITSHYLRRKNLNNKFIKNLKKQIKNIENNIKFSITSNFKNNVNIYQ